MPFLFQANIEIEMLRDWPGTICLQIVSRLSFCLALRLHLHILRMNRVRGPSVFRSFHGWLFEVSPSGSISSYSDNEQSPGTICLQIVSRQSFCLAHRLHVHKLQYNVQSFNVSPIVTRQLKNLNFHKF